MSVVLFSLPDFFNNYKKWVSKNPLVASDFETCAKWVSYFIAGRINNSSILSELVYCLSNLLVLFNDRIITRARKIYSPHAGEQLKVYLTVLKYSEVFFELSAQKLWGEHGRWLLITIIQLFKCLAKLTLLYHHQEPIVQNPPVQVLQRQKVVANDMAGMDDTILTNDPQINSMSFKLQRSGRVVRKISVAPPNVLRDWKPLQNIPNGVIPNGDVMEMALSTVLTKNMLIAETLYILKPIIHLGAMRVFGSRTWKPWMIALLIDIASSQIYHNHRRKHQLNPDQRLELSRRSLMFILYLIRSPFYDQYTKDRIQNILSSIGSTIPITAIVTNPLIQYLPQWQNTYFYMWSN